MSWLSLLVLPVVHGLILVVTALFWWSRPYYSRPYYSRSYYGGHILIMVVTALLWWSRPYYSRPYYGGHGLIIHGPIIHGLIMVVTALLWWSRPYYSRPYYSRPYYGGHSLIIHGPIIHGLILVVTALLSLQVFITTVFHRFSQDGRGTVVPSVWHRTARVLGGPAAGTTRSNIFLFKMVRQQALEATNKPSLSQNKVTNERATRRYFKLVLTPARA